MSSGYFQKYFLSNFTIFITLKGNKIILHHKCFKCLGYGHIASNCPTKRNMILNPKGEVESEHSSPSSPKSSSSHTSSQSSSEDEIKPIKFNVLEVGGKISSQNKHRSYQNNNLKVKCQNQTLFMHYSLL